MVGASTPVSRSALLVVGLCGLFGTALSAFGQAGPDFRNANPRQLVQTWKNAPRHEQSAIAEALIERRAEALPVLREAARGGDRGDKIFACTMIAELRDRASVDAVVAASTDSDVKVRRRAATVLRILADRRAAPRLRELVGSESDLGVLKSALAALGRLGDPREVALIAPFLDHASDGVRIVAAAALAMLGDERGLDLVIQGTYAVDPAVQKSATYALGLFRASAAAERAQAILDDPNGAWKAYALIAQVERRLAAESPAEQIATLGALASGRSRTAAEWAVDRLTDIGDARAAAALRGATDRETPVAVMAKRRLKVIEAQP